MTFNHLDASSSLVSRTSFMRMYTTLLAQWTEFLPSKQQDVGSNPTESANYSHVAQRTEHPRPKGIGEGSTPFMTAN